MSHNYIFNLKVSCISILTSSWVMLIRSLLSRGCVTHTYTHTGCLISWEAKVLCYQSQWTYVCVCVCVCVCASVCVGVGVTTLGRLHIHGDVMRKAAAAAAAAAARLGAALRTDWGRERDQGPHSQDTHKHTHTTRMYVACVCGLPYICCPAIGPSGCLTHTCIHIYIYMSIRVCVGCSIRARYRPCRGCSHVGILSLLLLPFHLAVWLYRKT